MVKSHARSNPVLSSCSFILSMLSSLLLCYLTLPTTMSSSGEQEFCGCFLSLLSLRYLDMSSVHKYLLCLTHSSYSINIVEWLNEYFSNTS